MLVLRKIIISVLLLGFCFYASTAGAIAVLIKPVSLQLKKNERITSFTIVNSSAADLSFQMKALNWRQEKGIDRLSATSDIVITPMVITVPAQDSRIVRVGLRRPVTYTTEATYRVILSQLPIDKKNNKENPNSVKLLVTFSLPLFIAPVVEPIHNLSWQTKKAGTKKLRIKLLNIGNEHVVISKLVLFDSVGEIALSSGEINARVLSGDSKEWLLSLKRPVVGSSIKITAATQWENKDKKWNAIVPIN